jgi:hypothetical protein
VKLSTRHRKYSDVAPRSVATPHARQVQLGCKSWACQRDYPISGAALGLYSGTLEFGDIFQVPEYLQDRIGLVLPFVPPELVKSYSGLYLGKQKLGVTRPGLPIETRRHFSNGLERTHALVVVKGDS